MNIQLPPKTDPAVWLRRWDTMQDRYIPQRARRFELMVHLVADIQHSPEHIVDIGCGTGSLMLPMLKKFHGAEVWGIDFDATLLALARERLKDFAERTHLIEADLRQENSLSSIVTPIDAAISATTLHWLSEASLEQLYNRLSCIIKPGGIFLNADHVRSSCPDLQKSWETNRNRMRDDYNGADADDWEGFWQAFGNALNMDMNTYRQKLTEPWEGSEQGLPLDWHFEKLRANGFEAFDCFWRLDCDAIYGAFKK